MAILDLERAVREYGSAELPEDQPSAVVVRMADVQAERVTWLWPARIPFGKLTVLDGDPKTGKSTVMLDIAARVSTGTPLPDGHGLDGPAGVVLMTAEDGLGDTVRPRLDAAGADPRRVVVFEAVQVRDDDGQGFTERPPSFPRDLDALEHIVTTERAALVIVDVLNAYLGSDVDGYKDQDIRRALMPLAKLAERTGAAVVALRHLTKSRTGSALYAGGGSIGIVGAARAVLLVAVDPDDEARRVLAVTACNVAAPAPALGFELVPAEEHDCARVRWLGVVEHRPDDLVSMATREDRSDLAEASEWLADFLSDGDQSAVDVKSAARTAGISPATLRRAKDRRGVVSVKIGDRWRWELVKVLNPAAGTVANIEGAQGAHVQNLEHLEHLGPHEPEDLGAWCSDDTDVIG